MTKRIERDGDDVLYHRGTGEVHRFLRGSKGEYTSPAGFYGMFLEEKDSCVIRQRFGRSYRFHVPEATGEILSILDRNHNIIKFSHSPSKVLILDTMRRMITISLNTGLMQDLTDHAGRRWTYVYDKAHRLIEVIQPATADFPLGTSLKYAYDSNHRLISLTDAKGQTYLVNGYDGSGRVVTQKHGSGVYKMEYEAVGESSDSFPTYRTICRRKNGSTLVLEHNEAGNAAVTTLQVRRESFIAEDIEEVTGNEVPLVTTSTYNRNAELTRRCFPGGQDTKWAYTEREDNPLNQGNLSQITQLPQTDVESDQQSIVTKYEYEPNFQFLASRTNPRGHKTSYQYDEQGNLIAITYPSVSIQPVDGGATRLAPLNRTQKCKYAYNSMGQLLRQTHIDGAVTEYYYYPVDDPCGRRGPNTATDAADRVCGYLARIVRDARGAKIRSEYVYDQFGNVAAVFDGKRNAARLRYNAMGKVERVTGREPLKHRIDYKYDANYNEIESAQSFERPVHDEATQKTALTSTTLRELKEYNVLDHVTARRIVGDDKIVTEFFIRDTNDRIVRQIQPLGNVTEYVFDERDLVIEKVSAAGTKGMFTERFTYTSRGAVRSRTDGNGNRTTHYYDGFQRYRGFTDPAGTTKAQWFDEMDNVVRVRVDDENRSSVKQFKAGRRESVALMEASYHFDQWNRAYRMDQVWDDPATGQALGESKWNGERGIVSTIVEYAENGLPGKLWSETTNAVAFEYDGAGRLTAMSDLTGEECSLDYDENSNVTLLRLRGPGVEGRRSEQVLRRSHDAMDRLEWQQENDDAPERFQYNALGTVINYVGKSGIEIHLTLDSLGRRAGHAFTVADLADRTKNQRIVRRYEYDDNYHLSAYVDAAGNRTIYGCDPVGRRTTVVFPDGTVARVDYDANGSIVKAIDQNKDQIDNQYDVANRLVERRYHDRKTDVTTVEQFQYDGAGRIIAAIAPNGAIRRSYDSLSQLLTEEQGDHLLRFAHDSAGNLTTLIYPGGEEVHKTYDMRNRVTNVGSKGGDTIARFSYRANDQMVGMLLGDAIKAEWSYNRQERLDSLEYRRTDNSELVEGFRYKYDDAGRMAHEVQLRLGSMYGERYYYDDANRVIKVQSDVQDVLDPASPFQQETLYEHFPEGSWKRRAYVNDQGETTEEAIGTIDQLNRYEHFGNIAFAYDADGNCIRRGTSNPGYCDYAYDQNMRLIESDCYDAKNNLTQTIIYSYDALGRQASKTLTDYQTGDRTETTYVWAGPLLLEEYENGVLVRVYIYGAGHRPVLFSMHKGGRSSSYYYTLNGRDLASGLVVKSAPYAFAERYRYSVTGFGGVTEISGMPVTIPLRDSTRSSMLNAVLHGDSMSGIGGPRVNADIDALLNSVNAFSEPSDTRAAFAKQLAGYLNAVGLGPPVTGSLTGAGAIRGGKNWSLYGAATAGDVAVSWVKVGGDFGALALVLGGAALASNPVGWLVFGGIMVATANIAVDSYRAADATTQYLQAQAAAQAKANAEAKGREDAEDERKVRERAGPLVPPSPPGDYPSPPSAPTAMGNPDSDFGGAIVIPSLQEVEWMLMKNKRPVDPNGDGGGSQIEPPSSKGPSKIDLIAHYDESHSSRRISVGSGMVFSLKLIGGGFTDGPRPEFAPHPPTPPEPNGGQIPNTPPPF